MHVDEGGDISKWVKKHVANSKVPTGYVEERNQYNMQYYIYILENMYKKTHSSIHLII